MNKAPKQDVKSKMSLNKSKSIKNGNGSGDKKSHLKQKSLDMDHEFRKNEGHLLEMKNKKKELINQAAVDILSKTESAVTVQLPNSSEKEHTIWDKIVNFFNPFKCGHH